MSNNHKRNWRNGQGGRDQPKEKQRREGAKYSGKKTQQKHTEWELHGTDIPLKLSTKQQTLSWHIIIRNIVQHENLIGCCRTCENGAYCSGPTVWVLFSVMVCAGVICLYFELKQKWQVPHHRFSYNFVTRVVIFTCSSPLCLFDMFPLLHVFEMFHICIQNNWFVCMVAWCAVMFQPAEAKKKDTRVW